MPLPFMAFATRALTVSAGLLIAGATLAAPVRNNNEAAAECASRAAIQLSIDEAQCAAYPTYAQAYGECRTRAIQAYASAIVKCGELAASAPGGREMGVTGVDTIKPESDAPARGSRKFRDPAVKLQQIAP